MSLVAIRDSIEELDEDLVEEESDHLYLSLHYYLSIYDEVEVEVDEDGDVEEGEGVPVLDVYDSYARYRTCLFTSNTLLPNIRIFFMAATIIRLRTVANSYTLLPDDDDDDSYG